MPSATEATARKGQVRKSVYSSVEGALGAAWRISWSSAGVRMVVTKAPDGYRIRPEHAARLEGERVLAAVASCEPRSLLSES